MNTLMDGHAWQFIRGHDRDGDHILIVGAVMDDGYQSEDIEIYENELDPMHRAFGRRDSDH